MMKKIYLLLTIFCLLLLSGVLALKVISPYPIGSQNNGGGNASFSNTSDYWGTYFYADAFDIFYPAYTNPLGFYNSSTLPSETDSNYFNNPLGYYNSSTLPAYPAETDPYYNRSWNESYADTLYMNINAVTGNSSWNESYANTTFARLDGSNQPFTGDIEVSKSTPEIRLTNENGYYSRQVKTSTSNNAYQTNIVRVESGDPYSVAALKGTASITSNPTNTFTMSAWINNSGGQIRTLVMGTGSESLSTGYAIYHGGVGTNGEVVLRVNANFYSFSPVTYFDSGVWTLWTITCDSGNATLYKNGVAIGNVSGVPNPNAATNIQFWERPDIPGSYRWGGYLDEVAIWNRSLTSGEVATIYNSGTGLMMDVTQSPWNNGLLAGWKIQEGSGTTTADISGNGRTITLTTETWMEGKVEPTATNEEINIWSSIDSGIIGLKGVQTFGDSEGKTIIEGTSINLTANTITAYNITASNFIDGTGVLRSDNTSWNESYANTKYLNRTSESLYTTTYNSTYHFYINNQTSYACDTDYLVAGYNANGTPICRVDVGSEIGAGDITAVIAGTGLTGGANSGDATLDLNGSYVVEIVGNWSNVSGDYCRGDTPCYDDIYLNDDGDTMNGTLEMSGYGLTGVGTIEFDAYNGLLGDQLGNHTFLGAAEHNESVDMFFYLPGTVGVTGQFLAVNVTNPATGTFYWAWDTNATTQCSGTDIPQGDGNCITLAQLAEVNSSDYWDDYNTPSDIDVGDFNDDGTYLKTESDTAYYTNSLGYYNVTTLPAETDSAYFTNSLGYYNTTTLPAEVYTDTNVTTQCSGTQIPLGNGSCIAQSELTNSVNSSDYWDSYDSPSDIDVGAFNNDGTYYPMATNPYGYINTTQSASINRSINIEIGDGSDLITAGSVSYSAEIPFSGNISKWSIVEASASPISCNITVDIWKDVWNNYAPNISDSITNNSMITLLAATKNSSSITTWNNTIASGETLGVYVNSTSLCKKVAITLVVTT